MTTRQSHFSKATRYLVGKKLPAQRNGNNGRLVEAMMSGLGYKINKGAGCDVKEWTTDIKSRQIESTSPHSIGSMTIEDIINLPYEETVICEKFQYHYRVKYSKDSKEIISAELYDFTDKFIQEKIKHAYESAREIFKKGNIGTFVKGQNAWGQFEQSFTSSNSFTFRIPSTAMEVIEHMSTSKFKDLFE